MVLLKVEKLDTNFISSILPDSLGKLTKLKELGIDFQGQKNPIPESFFCFKSV
mgnify:CR=1 FL=1